MEKDNKIVIEQLEELLKAGKNHELLKLLDTMDPADVADILEDIPHDQQDKIFAILDTEKASDVLIEMENNDIDDFIERADPEELAKFISEMATDDKVDVLARLDKDELNKVMLHIPEEDRTKLYSLLGYDEESAGGIMTPELCVVPLEATVHQAVMAIAEREFDDPISMVFVVDKNGHLEGAVHISELLSKPGTARMADVIDRVQAVAKVDEDQETIANNFRKYDLLVMPVVDEDGKLVGRITVDDVMDVIQDEAVEDIAHMAGAPDMETHEDSPVKIVALRMPWLLITMCAGLINSVIIQKMIGLTTIEGLAAYVPVVMAMGGNTGMQASAITVRGIALGDIEYGKLFKLSLKEIFVGIMMGLVCGLFTASMVYGKLALFGGMPTVHPLKLAFVVGISMCVAMGVASLCGTLLPIILHKWKIDPAVASGPFVTTGNDLLASMIYFFMCYFLL